IEAPQNDERARAVIAETKRLVPKKPIRYVVSTHHHFDHAGGLRAFVALGAMIVTEASNIVYYSNAFKTPATVEPDTLANTKDAPLARLESVDGKYVITDGIENLDILPLKGDTHSNELLIAYLPREEILVEADAYTPQDPKAQPSPPPASAVNLYENIRRLKLNVATIAPIHGRGAVKMGEFLHFIGAGEAQRPQKKLLRNRKRSTKPKRQ
ncbi:MAG: MBL fold metallo-hydrolase, partial [Acidobacteriota bacterium]